MHLKDQEQYICELKNSVYNDYKMTELDKCHEGIPLLSLIHIYPQKTHSGEEMS